MKYSINIIIIIIIIVIIVFQHKQSARVAVRGLRCARSHPCFNFSPFCVALTTIDLNALKTEH